MVCYACTQAGKQCWWGGRNSSSSGRKVAPASDCNDACAGNQTETCGGAWRVWLYTATCAPWVPQPPPPPPPPLPSELSVVFAAGDCDENGECYPCFRIPAIKRAKSGALLASQRDLITPPPPTHTLYIFPVDLSHCVALLRY